MSLVVIGAGAWGTALAIAAARGAPRVMLIGRDAAAMLAVHAARKNPKLPGVKLPPSIEVSADLSRAAGADLLILAMPCQALRAAAETLRPHVKAGTPAVIAAKGIEQSTGAFVSDVLAEALPAAIPLVLSGPSFAADVARSLPTAVTLAARQAALAEKIAQKLGSPALRIYHTDDLRGVEIGGAAKNVLAIAAGIVDGLGLGESARAALIARGFAELWRFAAKHGARPETLMGLSGLGDLLLSASSPQSRNFAFGLALASGRSASEAADGKLAEGAYTAAILAKLAGDSGVDMPIVQGVAAVLAGKLSVSAAVDALINRPQKAE